MAENLPTSIPSGESAQDTAEGRTTYVISNLPEDLSVRLTPEATRTQSRLAPMFCATYLLISLLVVVGGMAHVFTEDFVKYDLVGVTTFTAAVVYFYFRRPTG